MQKPAMQDYLKRYVRGSRGIDFKERIKIMKLLWDASGTEFQRPARALRIQLRRQPRGHPSPRDVEREGLRRL
jgi:hypothetical protein